MIPSNTAISTGLEKVDAMLGCGGLPRGRIVELFGPPGSGKSTIGLLWGAAAQRQKASVVFVDVERTLTTAWAEACGVNLDDLVVLQPRSGEEALSMTESLLRTFGVDLVVVDSAAALVPEQELESGVEDLPIEAHTDLLYRYLRRLQISSQRSGACVLFLNQTRAGVENETRTAGGRSLALYAAIRVRIGVEAPVREDGEVVGQRLLLTTVKNKLADPFAEALVELRGPELRGVERKPMDRHMAASAQGRRVG